MKCPKCGSGNTRCCDSREKEDALWRKRRYRCGGCACRFSTAEMYAEDAKELTGVKEVLLKAALSF